MKYLSVLFLFTFCCLKLYAAGEEPELKLDPDLVNELYKNSVTEAKVDTNYSSGYFRITPKLAVINSSIVKLENNYFEVPYQENLNGAPGVTILLSKPLFQGKGVTFLGQAQLSYLTKAASYQVISKSGTRLNDYVTLHWLPLSAGGQLEYQLSSFPWVVPGVTVGVGASYLYQLGKLDGISQGFWVPFYVASPQVTLFRQAFGSSWFGGVQISYSWLQGFGTNQTTESKTISAGVELLL